jgi:hypothetical protein
MTFLEQMDFAMSLYLQGKAPVLINKNGIVLHGQETLDMKIDPKDVPILRDIDITAEEWKVSHCPLTLESARQVWLSRR